MKKKEIKEFKRDKRSPIPSSEKISEIMGAIKQKNTKPELVVRRALFAAGIRGYRLHWVKVPGKPDLVFVSRKVAIFINGCFWHRCPYCKLYIPKSNSAYWMNKFEKNVARDERKLQELKKIGWKPIVVWECEIRNDLKKMITGIMGVLKDN